MAVLVGGPLLNGATENWAWGVVAAGVAVTAAFGPSAAVSAPRSALGRATLLWWMALAAFAAFQLAPLPLDVLKIISPARASLTSDVETLVVRSGDGASVETASAPLSVHPAATALALAVIATLATLYWLSSRSVLRGVGFPFRRTLILGLILIATVEAALALLQYAAHLTRSAQDLPFGLGDLAGSYLNKNGLGNLLALALPVTAGRLLDRMRRLMKTWREGTGSGPSARRAGPAVWLGIALAIQVAGVVLSLSRGASAAAGIALSVLLVLAAVRFRALIGTTAVWGVPVLIAFAVAFLLGVDRVLTSWANLDIEHQAGRIDWWETGWRVFCVYPFGGAGFGSFLDVSGAYRSPVCVMQHAEHAHNDYIETLSAAGVVGGIAVLSVLLLVVLLVARSFRRGNLRKMGMGCGLLAFAIHAAVDFPLAYGANVAWAVALWGILGAGKRAGVRQFIKRGRARKDSWGLALRAVLGLVALASAVPPILAAIADAGLGPARAVVREIRTTGTLKTAGKLQEEAWRTAFTGPIALAEEATSGYFYAGEAWQLLGALSRYRAEWAAAAGIAPEERHALIRALASYRRAIRLRPTSGETLMDFAELLGHAGRAGVVDRGASELKAGRAMELAARLAPMSPRVAIHEAAFWLVLDRESSGTPVEESGIYRRRAQAAYRRLLALDGLPDPARFMRDAWRRSGSVEFMLGCISVDRRDRAAFLFGEAERLLNAEGDRGDLIRLEAARSKWEDRVTPAPTKPATPTGGTIQ